MKYHIVIKRGMSKYKARVTFDNMIALMTEEI